MAMQTISGELWIPPGVPAAASAPAYTGVGILSAATHRFSMIFQVPKTGTLDWFETRQAVNSNTPDNGLRFSFQSLSAAGNPDNTESQYSVVTAGFGNGVWLVPPSYMGSTGGGSGSKRSVTKGEWLSCNIRMESFVASDSVTFAVLSINNLAAPGSLTAYCDVSTNSGSSWTKDPSPPTLALKYDDGTYGHLTWPMLPASTINTRTYASNTAGADERGLIFQVPWPCSLKGVWVRVDLDNAADLVLYDSGGSVVVTLTISPSNRGTINGTNGYFEFDTPITLTKNVNYRLSVKPTTTSSITIYDFDMNDTAMLAAISGGATWMSTNRVDAGAWTDVNTNRPFMGLVFDGFDDAVSATVTTAAVF